MASASVRPAKKKPARHRHSNTRQRIVDRSILLFNRYGLRNVAIDHIAAELDISPGNLTYHFPRRQDLLAATLAMLQARMRGALQRPAPLDSVHEAGAYMLSVYRALWDFRFFFDALTHLLDDPQLRSDYLAFRDWALDSIDGEMRHFTQRAYLTAPIAPNTFRLLAENLWALWLHWLRKQQVQNPMVVRPSDAALFDCALHDWSLLQSVLVPDASKALLEAFRTLLPLHAAEPPPSKLIKPRPAKSVVRRKSRAAT